MRVANLLTVLLAFWVVFCGYFAFRANQAYETGQAWIWLGHHFTPAEANTKATVLTICGAIGIVSLFICWLIRAVARRSH